MNARTKVALAGIAGLATAGLLAAVPAAASATELTRPPHHAPSPAFVLANQAGGNAVAVYDRGSDGSLTAAGRYATGGAGGSLTGSVVDHLASQGALTYDRATHLLYAVNAGSNTVSVFVVTGDRLHRVQIVHSGGSFPVSVAAHGRFVYVLNARDGGSIQGFERNGVLLSPIAGSQRSLGLDANAAPEFVNTPGEVSFTPDGTELVVTTKANKSQIDVFPLSRSGRPSAQPVVTADTGNVPFAVAYDNRGRLNVSEAGPNAVSTWQLNADGTLTFVNRLATGGAATCWIVSGGANLYVNSAGSASVNTFGVTAAGLSNRATTTTHGGTIDATLSGDGHNLYVQTGATGTVDVFSVAQDGTLGAIGSVTVPGTVGGEGIASA
jgi:6-phosphogluconolactonase (cycloisomerase 2 family)